MIDNRDVEENWKERGFSFGVFTDPPGHEWADFTHPVDELWMLGHGEMELEIEGKIQTPQVGEEVLIKAGQVHTVRNIGIIYAHWYYGYPSNP